MRRAFALGAVLVAVACWAVWAMRGERDAPAARQPTRAAVAGAGGPPRLVVLYAPCTVNASYLQPYRADVFFTPSLGDFAREALVFERHQSEADQSGTAYAALLSGRDARGHRVFSHPVAMAEAITTVTEAFAEAGFDVWFWGAQGMASAKLGYAQGVPRQNVVGPPPLSGDDRRFRKILDRVAADQSYRAFVVANFTVSHYPYADHVAALARRFPAATRRLAAGLTRTDVSSNTFLYQWSLDLQKDFPNARRRAGLTDEGVARLARVVELLYVSNVARLDELFGSVVRAVDERGLADESLIAFTADHGEVLYRDNALFPWSHDFQLAPEVLRVPLLLRGAGVVPGRVPFVTRSIDVYPTLAGLAGVPLRDPGVTGVDLSRVVRGEAEPPELLAFSHTPKVRDDVVERAQQQWALFASYYPSPSIEHVWVSVRSGDLVVKLRRRADGAFGFEAFDLASDPDERRDLFDPANPDHARLAHELERYKAELVATHDAAEAETATPAVDEKQLEALRRLGYVE
jgi:arylsulfatase A-like enzyme